MTEALQSIIDYLLVDCDFSIVEAIIPSKNKASISVAEKCDMQKEAVLEQFKGVLPLWLSPVQVNIIAVNEKYHHDYAKMVKERLEEEEIRVEYDERRESLGKKIRESNQMKNPYTLVLGDKEREYKKVSYRKFGCEENITMSLDDFVDYLKEEIKKR